MKAVLISIKPKWCELIASGKKTVEVRKTKPKLKAPFKVYIYCTRNNGGLIQRKGNKFLGYTENSVCGKVIGEFVCDWIRCEKEVADGLVDVVLESTSCVGYKELVEYANGNVLYSWHISDLVIYDEPKELREFVKYRADWDYQAGIGALTGLDCNEYLTRPFQSWGYVEDTE